MARRSGAKGPKESRRLRVQFATLLRSAMIEEQLDVYGLGNKIGVSRQAASNLISGDSNVTLDRAAEAFDRIGYTLSLTASPKKAR